MVAWMMDADLRLASSGAHGLDQLFARLWQRFGDGPVTDGDLRALYGELSGKDPGLFWDRFILGKAELDSGAIERAYGLTFTAKAPWELLANGEADDPDAVRRARVYAGLAFAGDAPNVVNVVYGSPGARAGLGYGMAILAVNGWRTVSSQDIQRRLGDRGPGDPVELLAVDRGRVRTFALTLEENPHRTVQLGADPAAGPGQREAFSAWTGQPFPQTAPRTGPK
jgi:predicted metalloprotease with PDZ domain